MAKAKTGSLGRTGHTPGPPKRTRQGQSVRTNLAATSRNGKRKRYCGQGK